MSGLELEGASPPATTPTADAALVAGLVARDPAAVADLYDRYAERLLGFCAGMLRDRHEAADALHDTILVAADRIGQLRDPERLRPWLYAIARTQCLARLRRRERTALSEDPTQLAGSRAVAADATSEGDGARSAEGGEAAELVWAAAEGLDEGDRVLLELHLRQGLAGNELADAAGVKPGQISMVTGRMRERLERALGALLVARHGRRDCDELDDILRDWDGRLTVLMRKRVARHVDRCATCDDRRTGLVAPLGSLAVGAPAVLATTDLRDAVLAGAERVWGGAPAPDVTEVPRWDGDGFPPDPPAVAAATADEATRRGVRRRAVLAAAAALLVLVGGLLAWRSTTTTGEDEVRADGGTQEPGDADAGPGGSPADSDSDSDSDTDATTTTAEAGPATTTTTGPAPTTPGTSPNQPGPTTTSAPPVAGEGGGPSAGPTVPDGGGLGTGTAPPATSPPPATPPPNRAPAIGQVTVPQDLRTACGSPTTGTVDVRSTDPDGLGGLTATMRVDSADGTGTVAMSPLGGGRFQASVGPFASAGTVTVTITVRDPAGATATTSRNVPLELVPC